jgi:hypothetical protein
VTVSVYASTVTQLLQGKSSSHRHPTGNPSLWVQLYVARAGMLWRRNVHGFALVKWMISEGGLPPPPPTLSGPSPRPTAYLKLSGGLVGWFCRWSWSPLA